MHMLVYANQVVNSSLSAENTHSGETLFVILNKKHIKEYFRDIMEVQI